MLDILTSIFESLVALGIIFWTIQIVYQVIAGTIKTAKNAVRKINS